MMVRDTARPGIEPQPLVEPALLQGAADFSDIVAAPEREAASAEPPRRFQDDAVVSRAVELVGRTQARDPGAEDDDGPAGAGILRQTEACGRSRRGLEKIP